ncbi:NAD(P)/FAD-dependent oxidoreductase [Paenibacillus macquariensis]|uniref:Thioredoxin reductase n=1 Tax=Paenibacillus macquariensis TaxID=948756 RepID=A0ABY1KG48_9BACL|nr:NAD(P)/FAD-dependent oxidoreductase [Paenibacillus macquariensis]MEC0093932.1 NAD(P)/FAD-dependent oxidoreductase [Paenibacillus macquariensis]OAB34301.1 pyridine nucleotide-disulfide oxidoreductase [Paenibacillus macquariensis subsp. macquariensis]SIR67963.1 Thioredoxin reductase [Paenibacillus macquariensis]
MMYDCAIVGGGPAALNAALVLGRARRSVALFDNNQPRNGITHASHGFITRDGIKPDDFRRIAYEEVLGYPSVQHWQVEVTDIRKKEKGFEILTQSGAYTQARKVILATGLKEVFPGIEGFHKFYGKSLFNCPYCDAWEMRDQPLAVISEDPGIFHMTKLLYNWSKDLIVCTNGNALLTVEEKNLLGSKGIRIIETPIAAFYGQNGLLEQVHFTDDTNIERSGGFITPKWFPKADFVEQLGYDITDYGGIVTDTGGRSSVTGLYAAGDAAYVRPSQVIYAAASGSKAAIAVNTDLVEEEFC